MRQKEIEELLTQQELQLLLRTPRARAVTCVKWVAARLAHLEALGYMAPLQLHDTNEGLQGIISAFNGLVKIKSTPTPFAIRQARAVTCRHALRHPAGACPQPSRSVTVVTSGVAIRSARAATTAGLVAGAAAGVV